MASGDISEIPEDDLVREETIEIFECFIETQLEIDRERNRIDPGTPGLPPEDLPHTPDSRSNVSWQIGKKLADIADSFAMNEESKLLINEIVQLVHVGPDDSRAFEEFTEIAKKVLVSGITWQNVATLFYFGYCIARDRLKMGIQHFLSQLLNWIISIFRKFGIFRWITNQGGWTNFLSYDPNEGNEVNIWLYSIGVISLVAGLFVLAFRKFIR